MRRKRILISILLLALIMIAVILLLPCDHQWIDATCTSARICSECQEIEGEPLGHIWLEATCETIQGYEGTVIARRNGGIRETFTVRRVSFGVGIERTFPLNSPKIDKIEVLKKGKVRRAKLFYLRDLSGKATNIKELR